MRDLIYRFLGFFDFLFRFYYRDCLKVLAYHKVPDPIIFDKQLQYLNKNYSIISIDILQDHFKNRTPLPEYPLLITFDDGDVSVLDNGFPLLTKFQFPSCLFIITGLIDTEKEVWIKNLEFSEIKKGKSYTEARRIVNKFKSLNNWEREKLISNIESFKTRQLTSMDINLLHNNNMYIGNHTHTHPMLDKCSKEEVINELNQSKDFFEKAQLPGFSVFAYPNGNNSQETIDLLIENGIKISFLFDHKVNTRQLNPNRISRLRVDADFNLYEFKSKVSGLHSILFHSKTSL